MEMNTLLGISPIDGRYRRVVDPLSRYFSEYALIKYRIQVEVEYFIALCELPLPQLKEIDPKAFQKLRGLYENFTIEDAERVKEIERVTNHDVKAVEYFIKEKVSDEDLAFQKEFIHFGLTSQDINNNAIPMALKDAHEEVIKPAFEALIEKLDTLARELKDVPMLARTHGQPASPTRLGKEIFVFVERLKNQMVLLDQVPFSSKFGGATGNFNAHFVTYPEIDWPTFADAFVSEKLSLQRLKTTTQIEHYDNFAAFCDGIKRLNTILMDLNRDMWTYISMD